MQHIQFKYKKLPIQEGILFLFLKWNKLENREKLIQKRFCGVAKGFSIKQKSRRIPRPAAISHDPHSHAP